MATITKAPSGAWKVVIRRTSNPTVSKSFRVKRDAASWARTTEDEIIRGIHISRSHSEKTSIKSALERYLNEVTPTKKASTQKAEHQRAKIILERLGQYSLASLGAEHIAAFRDARLAEGKSPSTVRLELALLGHLYTIAIKEWGMGLVANPVLNIRRPALGKGRDRRLAGDEEHRLLAACDGHSNPMLGWIVKLALYTGMRHGEIVNLKRNQVNLVRRSVHLTDTKNNSSRTVPLTNKATSVLEEAISYPICPIDTGLIFFGEPGRDGKRRPYVTNRVWAIGH